MPGEGGGGRWKVSLKRLEGGNLMGDTVDGSFEIRRETRTS